MSTEGITQDEAVLYDRQIRLWGLAAQQRIRDANVLVAGLRALSNEVCKNLALAGIGSITILDHEIVTEEDLGAQFFLSDSDIGKNRAVASAPAIQSLNPRVDVVVDQENINDKPDAYFLEFDIVCLVHKDLDVAVRINELRRNAGKPFYTADAFGWFGYIFCDLKSHSYIEERKQMPTDPKSGQEPTIIRNSRVESYVGLRDSLKKTWTEKELRKLRRQTPQLSFMIHIWMRFQQQHGRKPTRDDVSTLLENKARYLGEMGVNDPSKLDDELINNFISLYDTEMAPVAAIVGGVLAQEIIKVLSAKELPIQNWFYYNGLDGTGLVLQLE
ncbi:hypothetical protein VTP01DRAFT_9718 [Rhizomucor pusillus]|uniref:uncharacterized protein n=1 Tax=Rhizomucor pusillus TaxID=4840 RepID=UPI003743F94B